MNLRPTVYALFSVLLPMSTFLRAFRLGPTWGVSMFFSFETPKLAAQPATQPAAQLAAPLAAQPTAPLAAPRGEQRRDLC